MVEGPVSAGSIGVPRAVGPESAGSVGGIVGTFGIAEKGVDSDRCIVLADGVVVESLESAGGIVVTSSVAE